MMDDKIYDLLKWICLLVAPALCTLIITLNALWGWGLPVEAITGTITGITTFVGGILGISNMQYNKAKEETSDERK